MPAPFVELLNPPPTVTDALRRFANWPQVILFHSALRRPDLGHYSFLTADPLASLRVSGTERPQPDPFRSIRDRLAEHPIRTIPGLPPFQGGAAGMLTYEAGGLFETLPSSRHAEDWPYAVASLGLYDWVLAWDHDANSAWLIVQPLEGFRSSNAAEARVRQLQAALSESAPAPSRRQSPATPRDSQAPSFALNRVDGLRSSFDRPGYVEAVDRTIRYIRAGDIFQANLSQRLSIPATSDPIDLYLKLCDVNPAPFAGYYDAGPYQVISASPERFLKVSDGEVETRPIKGTRARRPFPVADLLTRDELRESEKDRAENVMIVDLLRNDLSRVCDPGSIRVSQLCEVETYETVQHLVSQVRGRLSPGRDFFDLLAAAFPGGSITGAPKIRAMQIIAELEQVPRGPYCGSLFYSGFDGSADSSILIRTLTCAEGWLNFPVGGGITVRSDPEAEYEETLHKAEGLFRALEA